MAAPLKPQKWSDTPHPYPGVPDSYQLDSTLNSLFGVPFYHFRSDWENAGPYDKVHNFYNESGDAASPGERVIQWSNTYGGGFGDARVKTANNYFGIFSAPILVEAAINKKRYKALCFTGREFLTIDGSEVIDEYNLTSPLYTTNGSVYGDQEQGYEGASFLFVVSADASMRNGYIPGVGQVGGISPYSALMYGRHPQTNFPAYGDDMAQICTNYPWFAWCPPGSTGRFDIPAPPPSPGWPSPGPWPWPPVQSNGIEFWYAAGYTDNVSPNQANWGYGGGSRCMMKFGPQGWHFANEGMLSSGNQWRFNSFIIPTREENNMQPIGRRGGSDGGFLNPPGFDLWEWPKCQSTPKTGLQAILLEFVGGEQGIVGPSHDDDPPWPELLGPYNGPIVNVFAISEDWLPGAVNDPPQGCPGFGALKKDSTGLNVLPTYTNKNICVSPEARTQNSGGTWWQTTFDVMRYPHNYPALRDQTLWYDKNLFLGGLPAVELGDETGGMVPAPASYGHGFKGYIFEILMFERVLNDNDKIKLFDILKAKYNKGLG